MSKITIVANITAKHEKIAPLKTALLKLIDKTRAESGCLQYRLHQNDNAPEHFLFFEVWASRTLWQQHLTSEHITDYKKVAADLVAHSTINEMTEIN